MNRLSLLFVAVILTACALPFQPEPSPQSFAPSPTPRGGATAAPEATSVVVAPTTETQPTVEATPTTAAQPTETTQPTAVADTEPLSGVDDPERIAAAVPAPRDQLALAEAFKDVGDIPDVARTEPLNVAVGDVETFWVSDNSDDTKYQITAELRYAGPIALMYVDTELDVDQADVERSAREFEERIYPRNRALFGEERSPGIDGDSRLTILNTQLPGLLGYFSSADGLVKAVNEYSNEREMLIMSAQIGTDSFAETIAHEFQHMIHANQQSRSPSWFNEGMSELATDLNGYLSDGYIQAYLADPDLQLTTWVSGGERTVAHYGAAQLFLRYVEELYIGEEGLVDLIKADAGNDLEIFAEIAAQKQPAITNFADLYGDWAVANILNRPDVADGQYAYDGLPGYAPLTEVEPGEQSATVNQFGVDYLGPLEGPLTLNFDGAETVGLTGGLPAEGQAMWWSNRGDDSIETLTREFDLTGVQQATLQFSAWHEIELNWDFGYVAASTDNGATWTTLSGATTTNENPQGWNLGNGLTGVSGVAGVAPNEGTRGQWIEEEMDLTPFAGQRILLRFLVVNDDAYNAEGLLIDNIRIPEIEYRDGAEEGDGGWQAQGFIRTTGVLPQEWTLRLVRVNGDTITVEPVAVDTKGRATVQIGEGERAALAVIGATKFTTESAVYTYSASAP